MRWNLSTRQVKRGAALALLLVFISVFIWPFVRRSVLNLELVTALQNASIVRVVEHSNTHDHVNLPPDYSNKIYKTVVLNQDQIAALRHCFWYASDAKGSGILKCTFVDHHYIEIVSKDGSTLTLRICFECGQFFVSAEPDDKWDYGDLGVMPGYWRDRLHNFISSLGMHPDGPWRPTPPP